uniref:RING-type domain-containing protein n=1 Tax=Panagrolaimus sp. PS1159 TaxID=55785 RepID=A0AC35G4Z0_9BILA
MACPWIHCNICLRLPVSNSRYFISNCGHIACDRCVEKKLIVPTCSICKRDSKVEEINKNLREDLRKYFVNIHDFAVKSFNEVKSVIEFQSKNCRRLMKYKMEKIQELQNTTIKHSEDSATIAKLQKQVDELQARNRDLENENKTLNSSFVNQQTLVNQLLSSGNPAMNVTPSFLQSSMNGISMTQNDLFNLVNASYLNASTAQKYHNESSLQESIISPNTLALDQSSIISPNTFTLDQSSINFGQSFNATTPRQILLEKILAQSTQKSTMPDRSIPTTPLHVSTLRPTQQEISEAVRTPSHARSSQHQISEAVRIPSHLRPSQHQVSENVRTPSNPCVTQPRQSLSVRPSQRYPDQISAKSRQPDRLNMTSRSWHGFRSDNSTLSTRTSRSAPSKTSLYKTPVVTHSLSTSNLKTPQPHPVSQRSRTVCPHWPKARCRCIKD